MIVELGRGGGPGLITGPAAAPSGVQVSATRQVRVLNT